MHQISHLCLHPSRNSRKNIDAYCIFRNYPSWLFVESVPGSGTDDPDSDTDLDDDDSNELSDEILLVVGNPEAPNPSKDNPKEDSEMEKKNSASKGLMVMRMRNVIQCNSDSEDEGWYSLSRTVNGELREFKAGSSSPSSPSEIDIILTNSPVDICSIRANSEGSESRGSTSSTERESYR